MSAVKSFKHPYDAAALDETRVRQARAANPEQSVWVAASAGTGKTKVLTDRILRLLLAGSKPDEILCLTYTKAAAAEMAGRLAERLTAWVTQPLAAVRKELLEIGVTTPDPHIDTARKLFARVLDCPGGLRIQTLHSFCQSVLARFPLEAGLLPGFKVLEEARVAELRLAAFAAVVTSSDPVVTSALEKLHVTVGETNLRSVLTDNALLSMRTATRTTIAQVLDIDPTADTAALRAQLIHGMDEDRLRTGARRMLDDGGKTNTELGAALADFLALPVTQRAAQWDSYKGVFFTKEGSPRKNIGTKAIHQALPDWQTTCDAELARLTDVMDRLRRIAILDVTEALYVLSEKITAHYSAAKRALGRVDYDDLVRLTENLLATKEQREWVRFKLDAELKHILVDEAQDTSPAQWTILRALAEEFLAGAGSRNNEGRTLFVVGDEKQTIYGFQGADTHGFARERRDYTARFAQLGVTLGEVELDYSFRSVSAVLELVNDVFGNAIVRAGVAVETLAHKPARHNDCGMVEVWNLLDKTAPPKDDSEGWELPGTHSPIPDQRIQLAKLIAQRIRGWLDSSERLAATGQRITPGDIMILVQRRKPIAGMIVRELKAAGIDVAGIDKISLTEQMAVQDIMALIAFVLLPDDDLNTAALLKSPLIGYDEQQLFDICHKRSGKTVWQVVQAKDARTAQYLESLRLKAGDRPYDFVQRVLRDGCLTARSGWQAFRAALGDEVIDPLAELLNAALAYENDHMPTLQGFFQSLQTSAAEVKRELTQAHGKVRVMTAHGSKGLQAPIVFLADAGRNKGDDTSPLLRDPDDRTAPVLYVPSKKDYMTNEVERRTERLATEQLGEFRRLLYVAMTRVEDRLIVCGTKNTTAEEDKNYLPERNWHAAISDVVKKKAEEVPASAAEQRWGLQKIWRYTLHKVAVAQDVADEAPKTPAELPEWAYQPAPQEAMPPRPLVPSKMMEPESAVLSPLAGDDHGMRFAAGLLTHELLQLLPGVTDRARVIESVMKKYEKDVSAERRATALQEVDAIMNDAQFAPLFGPRSRAEVPIVGLVGTRTVSGQIDRLAVTDTEVLVVDYKTNRPLPNTAAGVPEEYLKQMASYVAVLENIYKGRTVRAALLWTNPALNGPRLMPLEPAMLAPHKP